MKPSTNAALLLQEGAGTSGQVSAEPIEHGSILLGRASNRAECRFT